MDGHEKAESDVIKHRKRVLTPARKEQNRIAQRLYSKPTTYADLAYPHLPD